MNKRQKTSDDRIIAWKHHFFTLNNYTLDDVIELIEHCEHPDVDKYIFQEEIGEENGTPHLQGYISYHKKQRWSKYNLTHRIQWFKCRSPDDAIKYCSKAETHFGARFTNIILPRPLLDPMAGLTMKQWQQDIIEMISKPATDRIINWYWDAGGNVGKTTFAKHLVIKYGAQYLTGRANDIKHAIATIVASGNFKEIAIFYYTRSNEDFVSYQALEEIKDGCFFSPKYESQMVVFNTPHIIVFANFPPDETTMSKDRWRVFNISEDIIDFNY